MSNYFALRRQMDQFMNDLWTTHPSFYGSHSFNSLFNDPFFNHGLDDDDEASVTVPLPALADNKNNNNNSNNNNTNTHNQTNKDNNTNTNNNNTQLSNTNNNDNNKMTTTNNNKLNAKGKVFWPASIMHCDIHEENDKFVIQAELPGVSKEDLNVSVENGILSIKGSKASNQQTDTKNKQGVKIHRSERSYGSFQRSFTLPNNTDPDPKNFVAKFDNGLLTLSLPKKVKADTTAKHTIAIQ